MQDSIATKLTTEDEVTVPFKSLQPSLDDKSACLLSSQLRSESPLLMRKEPRLFQKSVLKMRKDSRDLENLQAWQGKKDMSFERQAFESDMLEMHKKIPVKRTNNLDLLEKQKVKKVKPLAQSTIEVVDIVEQVEEDQHDEYGSDQKKMTQPYLLTSINTTAMPPNESEKEAK